MTRGPYSTVGVSAAEKSAAARTKAGDQTRQGRRDEIRGPVGTFEAVRFVPEWGGLTAYIGIAPVAYIRDAADGRRALYHFALPLLPTVPEIASSPEKAQGAVRRRIAQWFEGADHVLSAAAAVRLWRNKPREAADV